MIGRLLRAWMLTAILDGLFSSALNVFAYGSTVKRLWQGVASTVFGAAALEQDTMAWVGLAMHFGVALTWSAVFLLAYKQSNWFRGLVDGPDGLWQGAVIYGPLVWVLMSIVVIPQLTGRPPAITYRWWVQFFGHAIFVGLPIVAMIRRPNSTDAR
jgi:uncharacterized membrane protein YagU involved in acid resistance